MLLYLHTSLEFEGWGVPRAPLPPNRLCLCKPECFSVLIFNTQTTRNNYLFVRYNGLRENSCHKTVTSVLFSQSTTPYFKPTRNNTQICGTARHIHLPHKFKCEL